MPLQVINQLGMCYCSMGAMPTPILGTSNQTVFCSSQLAATIMDFAPIANITPFGVCATLTAAALGVPTPCVPATIGPWSPGSPTNTIQGFPNLRDCDVLPCAVGGVIMIQFAGQVQVDVD
ncbi:DUF4280 domain-containing protein [Rhodoblastus sp.]|jgi:hypothetical protein|uniref:DUF4280 domain-containing protein n=1 Tax=Rhodoblastus sp. TaxID=1962975 RepID=UPI0025D5FF5C|nr:DUF4280 domain-containing protein [Rhodoblastus sp.]